MPCHIELSLHIPSHVHFTLVLFQHLLLFYDPTKCFFGPVERRLFMLGFLRLQTYINIFKAESKGNLKGDGTLLGGVYVIGPGDSGIIFEHREKYFGDYVNSTDVIKAVEKMSKSN